MIIISFLSVNSAILLGVTMFHKVRSPLKPFFYKKVFSGQPAEDMKSTMAQKYHAPWGSHELQILQEIQQAVQVIRFNCEVRLSPA